LVFTLFILSSAYLGGMVSPLDIAQDIIQKIKIVNSELHIFCDYREDLILKQANESTKRYEDGKVLGPLDGVPIVIKDQIHVIGLTRRNGTEYPEFEPSVKDGAVIEKIRAQG
jgi:aspartyl-tRNA(Asn)/glutamyl-tRNA(Gln) amidotransferase subunit A